VGPEFHFQFFARIRDNTWKPGFTGSEGKHMRNAFVGTLAAVALMGCGGGKTDFVGTWSDTGSESITCSNGTTKAGAVGGNTVLVEGTDSDLVETSSSGCNIKMTVSGNTATAIAGQSCLSSGTTVTVTSDVITLSGDKKSFTQTVAASATANGNTCNVTGTVSGTKVGK
jgi:hypothetical protein